MLTEHIIRSDAELCAVYGEGSKAAMLKEVDFKRDTTRDAVIRSTLY